MSQRAARLGSPHITLSVARTSRRRHQGAGAALVGVAVANAVAIVALWWGAGGVSDVHDAADLLTSSGRLAALLGAYLALVAVLLLARVPLLERRAGFGRLVVWHRHVARWCLVLLLAHAALTVTGLALGDRISLPREVTRLISQYPGVITATAGLLLLVAVAVTSARTVRRRLRYESWYGLHLYVYLAIALAFSHQVATGRDFVGDTAARAYWTGLYVVTLGALALFRIARPLALAARHRLRVERVKQETPGVVSIEVTGRHLERLRARPGQFFLWRFLTADCWGQAHPFSLSAVPNPRRLRITIGASGDFSAAAARLRPGTRVLVEGPFGAFIADLRRRPSVALIAAGAGIAPVRALLESMPGDIELLYRPRDSHKILFREEIDRLASARGARVHYLSGAEHDLTPQLLRRLVPDIAERGAFVCGPPAMVKATCTSLKEAGVRGRDIVTERFAL